MKRFIDGPACAGLQYQTCHQHHWNGLAHRSHEGYQSKWPARDSTAPYRSADSGSLDAETKRVIPILFAGGYFEINSDL